MTLLELVAKGVIHMIGTMVSVCKDGGVGEVETSAAGWTEHVNE